MFYTGRLAVVSTPTSKEQYHYDFHTNRISCAAVHPNRIIACTASVSGNHPTLHIWDTSSMTPLKIITAKHDRTISRVEFSRDGSRILTLGGSNKQTLEMHEWASGESLAFRELDNSSLIFDIKFNPYNSNQIAVSGGNCLWLLKS